MKKRQIETILPKNLWTSIIINENNDPLTIIKESSFIKINVIKKDYAQQEFKIRHTVFQKLVDASKQLPKGYSIVVIEGYRSLYNQKQSWERAVSIFKETYPSLSQEEVERKARLVVAEPTPLANHNCGGAVDVTLMDQNGILLDMGSPYPATIADLAHHKKFPMFPNTWFKKRITKQQAINRKLLRDAMVAAGFVWYPGEWWHYCYGDRMWAVYTDRKECFFGPLSFN